METIFNRIQLLEKQLDEATKRCDDAIRKSSALQSELIAYYKKRDSARNNFAIITFSVLAIIAYCIFYGKPYSIWAAMGLGILIVVYFVGAFIVYWLRMFGKLPKSPLQKLYEDAESHPELKPWIKIVRIEEDECKRLREELGPLYQQVRVYHIRHKRHR